MDETESAMVRRPKRGRPRKPPQVHSPDLLAEMMGALEEIAREQSTESATHAADKFQQIARAVLTKAKAFAAREGER